MKQYILLFLLCLAGTATRTLADNTITVGLIVPEQQAEIDNKAFRLLETKLKTVMSANGVTSEVNGSFVLYPVVNIIENKLIEGGLKNMYAVELEMSLFIRQLTAQTEFGSCSKTLKGSGRSLSEAIRNAFTTIKSQDNVYSQFLAQSKERIADYYLKNRSNILNQANQLASTQQYEQALALLITYPQTLEGAGEVQQAAIGIYKKYQNKICTQLISSAKGAVSLQDYPEAIRLLSGIDSESVCYADALKLMKQVEWTIKANQKEEKEFEKMILEQEANLEGKRIDAIKEIAVAYTKNQPQITYTQIIR